MNWIVYSIAVLNLAICFPTVASLVKFNTWWIRDFDFPRVQIIVLIVINLCLAIYFYDFSSPWQVVILAMLILSLVYQSYKVYPYTPLAKTQVADCKKEDENNPVSLLVSNVLTPNRGYMELLQLVKDRDPDIVLTLETDKQWEEALKPLELAYSYTVKVPEDNLYGMHLYSKLPLQDIEVDYLVKMDTPSIHGKLLLRCGTEVAIHCLHPRPPSPTESSTSVNRDAELLLVAKDIDTKARPILVFGDFNDVAWSRTTKLFQEISGLLDPRRGRGFFNTYNANYKFIRWPLDHVFHSSDFTLIELSRCRNIGSDHFPMYAKLNYRAADRARQETPAADSDQKQKANEKIEKSHRRADSKL